MMNLYDTIEYAKSELADNLEGEGWTDEPHDLITELADQATPIYTYDILAFAQENLWLATEEPEIGSDGTAIGIISANIYEHISQELWNHYDELVKERELENELY